MKIFPDVIFEENESSVESRERNISLRAEFQRIFESNCLKTGRKLTHVENTRIFTAGSITRLLLPPRTHHADLCKRISENLYVTIKK